MKAEDFGRIDRREGLREGRVVIMRIAGRAVAEVVFYFCFLRV